MNPKIVDTKQFYGYYYRKQWEDGLFSKHLKRLVNMVIEEGGGANKFEFGMSAQNRAGSNQSQPQYAGDSFNQENYNDNSSQGISQYSGDGEASNVDGYD